MMLRCHSSTGHTSQNPDRGLQHTEQTVFNITPGQEYSAYGMALFNSGLIVLILDNDRSPDWYPIELFEITDGALLSDWRFNLRSQGDDGLQAVWGPDRLVSDQAYFDSLAEHDLDAQTVFWREIYGSEG